MSINDLLHSKRCVLEQIFSENIETFTHPLLLPSSGQKSNTAFTVIFGARDDILRAKCCIAVSSHESSREHKT